jgi:hypothetical protein
MILTKPSKTLLGAAGISLALLALTATASLAQDHSQMTQTSGCSCCQKMMGQGSRS